MLDFERVEGDASHDEGRNRERLMVGVVAGIRRLFKVKADVEGEIKVWYSWDCVWFGVVSWGGGWLWG